MRHFEIQEMYHGKPVNGQKRFSNDEVDKEREASVERLRKFWNERSRPSCLVAAHEGAKPAAAPSSGRGHGSGRRNIDSHRSRKENKRRHANVLQARICMALSYLIEVSCVSWSFR